MGVPSVLTVGAVQEASSCPACTSAGAARNIKTAASSLFMLGLEDDRDTAHVDGAIGCPAGGRRGDSRAQGALGHDLVAVLGVDHQASLVEGGGCGRQGGRCLVHKGPSAPVLAKDLDTSPVGISGVSPSHRGLEGKGL